MDQNGAVLDASIMRSSLFLRLMRLHLVQSKKQSFIQLYYLERVSRRGQKLSCFFLQIKKLKAPAGIASAEIDNLYQTQVTGALADLGIKLSDQQEVDFSVNFKAKISESDNENTALHLQEEIEFLKNEIQNFIYHVNNEEGSLETVSNLSGNFRV